MMEARARLFGHPIHQIPLGLLGAAVVFDIVYLVNGSPRFADIAYWLIVGGIVAALVAAPFGTLDWLKIPKGTRAKRVGALHGLGNVVVVLLFLASWWLRRDNPLTPETVASALAIGGFALSGLTAWLGGELVDRLGVGVDEGANLNAPSSLSGKPAH